MSKFKSIIFDIDGTLTHDISWVYLTEGIGSSIKDNDTIFDLWRNKVYSEEIIRNKLIENWWKGGRAFKNDFKAVLERIDLREDAKETIDYLKIQGYKICMITGSFDIYAEIISKKLEIPEWFSVTQLIWDEEEKLVDIETFINDKQQKIKLFKKYCKDNDLQLDECVVVGDSSNDIGLFELTGNGIAVRTEFEAKELEEVAWKKVDHLIELKNIL